MVDEALADIYRSYPDHLLTDDQRFIIKQDAEIQRQKAERINAEVMFANQSKEVGALEAELLDCHQQIELLRSVKRELKSLVWGEE